jgi:hypothetical protein
MTTLTAPTTQTQDRLRSVLLADAVVTVAVGLFGLLGPASWYAGPSWLARAVGAGFVLVGIEAGVIARGAASRLRAGALAIAAAAFSWTVVAWALAALVDMDPAGREVLLLTGLGTLAFGVVEVRTARRP